ncbi:MAG: LCP family protein [Clostridia bacterium]|nr:LCP family protein [Clostridia bacterium]
MNGKKTIALLTVLMLVFAAVAGALSENTIPMPDPGSLQQANEAQPSADIQQDDGFQPAEDSTSLDNPNEDWMAGTEQQDVVVDQAYTIDDFAVTEGLPDNWVNILLLGTDVKYTNQYGRTDSMIVMSVNLATKQAKLTSFMRDIWVSMDGRSKTGKLNSACLYGGPALVMRTINEHFGLNLQYYALVNLSSMAEIIDLLGGLDLDVTEKEMNALNKGLFDLSPLSGMEKLEEYGENVHLNGNQATAYARIRKIDSDYKRTERQRYVLTQIAKRLQQENAGTIVSVIMKLLSCVETNMNMTQLMTIAAAGLQMNMDNIPQFRVPADNTYQTGTYEGIWAIKVDFNANKQKLHKFIYG